MRTTVIRAGRIVAAVAGVLLGTGCGSDVAPSAEPKASSTAPFGQKTVQADLDAALAAAGLPEGQTEVGYPETGRRSAGAATAEEEQKLAALAARLSTCVVSWASDDTEFSSPATDSTDSTESTELRRQLDVVLSDLETRDWERAEPSTEVPVAENGTYFMATYKKQGWTLHARHSSLQTWSQSTVMATEDDCFSGVTDEELALVETL